MTRTEIFKEKTRKLWSVIKWIVFILLSIKIVGALDKDGRYSEGWILNLAFTILALGLLIPGIYGRKINPGGKLGFLSKFFPRLFLASVLLWLPILNIGHGVNVIISLADEEYKAYVAYQKLSHEEKNAFDLAELKREQEEAMAYKIRIRDTISRSDEEARLAGIRASAASSPSAELRPVSYVECVSTGIDYFKSINAYPTLSTGENAAQEASLRCGRTTRAFGPWD
ncbi:hypothetical protein LMK08_24550 [Metapseudomonas furukawaii]|uniref:hypothetical protein n=1 Tax=Metapseudomonas furukawaii TaxID=1149133 RepID=UPI00227BBBE8|nr:hypothetical protein [Pseudomonas furukawaii]WAG78485.1 hypothetical protein LMK08_24550 [Pseudomonas furukawaii]